MASKSRPLVAMRRSSRLAHGVPATSSPRNAEPRPEIDHFRINSRRRSQKREPQLASKAPAGREDDLLPKPRKKRTPKRAKVEGSVVQQLPSTKVEYAKVEPLPACAQDIEDILEAPAPRGRPSALEARETLATLVKQYGRQQVKQDHQETTMRPVLDSLVATILSQATSNVNSSRAFKDLKNAFPDWDLALRAGPTSIADAIRVGGLADAKGKRIHAILDELRTTHGECTLEHLRDVDDGDAKRVLCAFPGVGPKTAACVLMFGMGRAEFPVDTHVRRITTRLGWMPDGSSAEAVYDALNAILPPEVKYDLHVLLIDHGRAICNARNPKCEACPLRENCQYFLKNVPAKDKLLAEQ